MNTIEKNTTKVVLNTPIDLDLAQFGAINHTKNIHKLIWLIHQINKYTLSDGKLKMHKQTYYKFLGLAPKDLNKYLNILKGAGLIEQTKVGNNISETLSEFVFLNTFEPLSGNKHTYDVTNTKCPLFIRKWVADGFAVKGISTYKKTVVAKKTKSVVIENANEVFTELESLRKRVAELEKENAVLRDKANRLVEPVMVKPIISEIEPPVERKEVIKVKDTFKELVAKDGTKIHLSNANDLSDLVIQRFTRIYNPIQKTFCVRDENREFIWFTDNNSYITTSQKSC